MLLREWGTQLFLTDRRDRLGASMHVVPEEETAIVIGVGMVVILEPLGK